MYVVVRRSYSIFLHQFVKLNTSYEVFKSVTNSVELVLFEKLIVAHVCEKLPARCGALRAVLLTMHIFWGMALSSGEYFSNFQRIIVFSSSRPDILSPTA